MRRLASLALHLGPWAGGRVPGGVRRAVTLEGRTHVAWYEPRGAATGAVLVAHGLHYLGPDDPRLDRFCRALASSGCLVACPFLADYIGLRVSPGAEVDLGAGLGALERRVALPVSGFSISFGSLPALSLAARAGRSLRKLVVFGGYADFFRTIRGALGERAAGSDPLNGPVVLRHILPFLEGDLDRSRLGGAMETLARRTWGRPELKVGEARAPHAQRIAATLPPEERRIFLASAGLLPGAAQLLELGLVQGGRQALAFADIRGRLSSVRVPTVVVHGKDDDVISFEEGRDLAEGIPGARFFATGVYGHTAAALPSASGLAAELGSLAAILGELAAL